MCIRGWGRPERHAVALPGSGADCLRRRVVRAYRVNAGGPHCVSCMNRGLNRPYSRRPIMRAGIRRAGEGGCCAAWGITGAAGACLEQYGQYPPYRSEIGRRFRAVREYRHATPCGAVVCTHAGSSGTGRRRLCRRIISPLRPGRTRRQGGRFPYWSISSRCC